jgi:hypothetical protein
MTPKNIALGVAGVGALAALGFVKWKLLRGGNAWWAIILGGLLFAATTTSAATGGESGEI